MNNVSTKFYKQKELVKGAEARSKHRGQLVIDLRNQQLLNTQLAETISDQTDSIQALETQVGCLKKEILTGSQRQFKYLNELNELVTDLDQPIMHARAEVAHARSVSKALAEQRDACFKAMVDLQVERRILLGKVNT